MSAPLAPPNSLDQIVVGAGNWAIQVEVAGEWEWVIGATSFDLQTPKTLVDASDINFGQWGGQASTEVNWTATMNLLKKLGQGGDVPPSTVHLLERAVGVGPDGMTKLRCWRTDGFPEAWEGRGDVSTSGGGGDKKALYSTTITITGYGPLSRIDKPVDAFVPKTITIGAATAGTFTLTVDGQTTAAINYNATASTVKSALEALSTVESANITGSAGGPYTVVSLAGPGPLALTGSGTGLTGGSFSIA
ncbi:phage tail tube protein [Rhodococcus qingshengii]|uniref:phage tail tube protein n=1 Tax=Rhodococcus qingshengii TaxID=334542 RepID=UPI0010A650A7|nr:hypothetical protein [Rhodococcus qingshengii]THJ69987.1 hypothetical protein EU244_20220 [Rhodococcus qingshengii]